MGAEDVMGCGLEGICLFEKDFSGEVVRTWTFPSIEDDVSEVIEGRSQLTSKKPNPAFTFSKFRNLWIYIHTSAAGKKNQDVSSLCFAITSKSFHPERYEKILSIVTKTYAASHSIAEVSKVYLAIYTKQVYKSQKNGSFKNADFTQKEAFTKSSLCKSLAPFAADAHLLWHLVVLKKRVLVISSNLKNVQSFIRTLPLLAFHRLDWDVLRPWIQGSEAELEDLSSSGVYIVGATSHPPRSDELFDAEINLDDSTLTLSAATEEDLILTATHKAVTKAVKSGVDDDDSLGLVKLIGGKTKELVKKLSVLADEDEDGEVTEEAVDGLEVDDDTKGFMWSLALAEGLAQN